MHCKIRSRIWIEGKRLIEAGFVAKETLYTRTFDAEQGTLTLKAVTVGAADKTYRVSGKGLKPVIDCSGSSTWEFFGQYGHSVYVDYSKGIIVISLAN